MIARLKPGVTVPMANAQLKLAADQYRSTYPGTLGPNSSFGVVLLQELMVRDTRSSLYVLLGAVGLVLLIACANVANLLLIRATARKRELATRSALGAGRWHIIRQLLTESLVISLTGGMLGLILGFAGVRFLLAINPGSIPRIGEDGSAVTVDLHVLLFTLGVSVLTGIFFGLVPAISASRKNLAAVLNESSNRAGVGFRSGKVRSVLVVSEMALALVLVIGAALLIRTFMKLQSVDPGFDTHNVLTMAMSISGDRFQKTSGVAQVIHDGTERHQCRSRRHRRSCRVLSAACKAASACLSTSWDAPTATIPTRAEPDISPSRGAISMSSRFPFLRGRNFTEQDNGSAPGVVIINEAMARQFWPKGDPLNDRLVIGARHGPGLRRTAAAGHRRCRRHTRWRTQSGPRSHHVHPGRADAGQSYGTQLAHRAAVVDRAHADGAAHAHSRRHQRDPRSHAAACPSRTFAPWMRSSSSPPRANVSTCCCSPVFGASALLMAAIGIYGLMAYSVQQRTQELGVRMALGAQASNIRNMVIRQGMLLAGLAS